MKNKIHPQGPLTFRNKVILTSVIPILIPWAVVTLYAWLPEFMIRFFLFTKGVVAWTLVEYCMHRWAMHRHKEPGTKQKDTFRHHHHHAHPDEIIFKARHKIAGVFLMGIMALTLFMGPVGLAYFAGWVTGMITYMLMHWFLHQKMAATIFPNLVRQHIWHHCKYPNMCFGITTTLWDRLFKTHPEEFKLMPEKLIRFYYKHEHPQPYELDLIATKLNKTPYTETKMS